MSDKLNITLRFKTRKAYGKINYYPVCEISQLLIFMMGSPLNVRVSLTEKDIYRLKEHGCKIQIEGETNE